jgi:hypothetical protein
MTTPSDFPCRVGGGFREPTQRNVDASKAKELPEALKVSLKFAEKLPVIGQLATIVK